MTITLCGFPVSNYYNKVKLVLLEKGLPFTEEVVTTGSKDEAILAATPLGKIPFIRVNGQTLCESQVIVDFLDAQYPQHPLMPADPLAAAKLRELATFIELHLELVARELYGQAFFGAPANEEVNASVRKRLTKNIAAFRRLARFAPYVGGDTFTLADCAAWVSLPLIGASTKTVLGEDLLATAGVDWRGYGRMIGERPAAAKVMADRAASLKPKV